MKILYLSRSLFSSLIDIKNYISPWLPFCPSLSLSLSLSSLLLVVLKSRGGWKRREKWKMPQAKRYFKIQNELYFCEKKSWKANQSQHLCHLFFGFLLWFLLFSNLPTSQVKRVRLCFIPDSFPFRLPVFFPQRESFPFQELFKFLLKVMFRVRTRETCLLLSLSMTDAFYNHLPLLLFDQWTDLSLVVLSLHSALPKEVWDATDFLKLLRKN